MSKATVLTLSALAIAASAPATAGASAECGAFLMWDISPSALQLANCTTVTGPWVVTPVGDSYANSYMANGTSYDPGTAGWSLQCPGGVVAGADWVAGGPVTDPGVSAPVLNVDVSAWDRWGVSRDPGSGTGLPQGADFLGTNNSLTVWDGVWTGTNPRDISFQPLIGCIPAPSQAPGTASRRAHAPRPPRGSERRRVRVKSVELQPSRVIDVTHGCSKGERLASHRHAVGFFSEQPPTRAEMNDVAVTVRKKHNRLAVHVVTGPHAGDDERVSLQIHATCARPLTLDPEKHQPTG
jgi:hypothetical protein